MNDQSEQHKRYLYRTAGGKWVFGPKGGVKLIRHMTGFEDLVTGFRYPNQCVLKTLMGVDNDTYIPNFGGDKCLDELAKEEIQEMEKTLTDNITAAKEYGFFDEAREYQKQLDDIQRCLKGDFITASVVKRLFEGEILTAFTHVVRQRKLSALRRLGEKEGFVEEADDLKRSFDVSNRNIVFLKDVSAFEWILKPDE